MMKKKRKNLVMAISVLSAVLLVVLAFSIYPKMNEYGETKGKKISEEGMMEGTRNSAVLWQGVELTDVSTGEKFKISDFEGKPVLLESFAVWCPRCKSQQQEIKKLHAEVGDSVISIGLNTDPNENEQLVKNYIDENGFDWHYAVAPVEMTQLLISEFGNSIINAPSVPIILVCEDGSYRKLANGVKSSSKLKEEISKGC
jgi:thiol-disulfide isomerase/thioredoxin